MKFLFSRYALMVAISFGMLVPVAISAWLAGVHGQMRVKELAMERSELQIQRSTKISAQIASALQQLGSLTSAGPCSAVSIRKMRDLVMGMNLLLDVGHVSDNALMCSSFGSEPLEVGEPSYHSPSGHLIRINASHPGVEGVPITMTTDAWTGFTTLVHPDTMLDFTSHKIGETHGLVGLNSGVPIAVAGVFDDRWLPHIRSASQGVVSVDGAVLAWKHSDQYDYSAFASVSAYGVEGMVRQTLLVLVPVGLIAGGLISVAVLLFLRNQSSMPSLLKAGLRKNEFFVVYQPIVELKTGAWVGAEALVRWRRDNGEMIGPDTFIPIAEDSGQICEITMRVLELIERDAAQLFYGHKGFFLSINFSAQDFANPLVIEKLDSMVKHLRIAPDRIHVEATERVFMDLETTRRNVARMREIGVKVSIDDFGTGYSSLSHLASVELDALKIDRVFVQTVGTNSVTSSVIGHIIAMAQGLKLKIIAEGVETEEQAAYLRQQGVELVQGWLYSKPIDAVTLRAGASSGMDRNRDEVPESTKEKDSSQ
ncbi:EAL domain-containing protein [Hydrogenophaga defluvii]|uniref:cyclic-guanylate-specific phosphodiesterase n=1 Tax=Hydrogenophaga defluvii TaxID=249410 RepID=A0ABW2SGM6_9BURK